MTTNTTDHLQALRKQVADVLERHRTNGQYMDAVTGKPHRETCRSCCQYYPCDAADLARQMTTLLEELMDATREMSENADDPSYSPYAQAAYGISACLLDEAIASAAQERETNMSDERRLSAEELADLRQSATWLASADAVSYHQGCGKNALRMLDHIDAIESELASLRAAVEAMDAPITFDLRDLVVVLDCLDADARSPWLIGAHELAPDRHRIAEIIRSAINDADISDVRATYCAARANSVGASPTRTYEQGYEEGANNLLADIDMMFDTDTDEGVLQRLRTMTGNDSDTT